MKYVASMRSVWRKFFKIRKPCPIILGIETSCDDTASAVVRGDRKVLGECVRSQQEDLIRMGGILPTMARDWHESNIERVVDTALKNARITMNDVNAIAVTVKPGLSMSLVVGMQYGKNLSKKFRKFFIPIHHMEAHALTAKLQNEEIEYPFLTLLISGGHCILAVAQSVDKFITLGQHTDNAPGEVLDKIARRLKLHNLPHLRYKCGGAAVEEMAKTGNTNTFEFPLPFNRRSHCDFSFSGFKSQAFRFIEREEKKFRLEGDQILPNADDFCASFQYCIIKHIVRRLQRGMEFVRMNSILPDTNRALVVSGGVACNSYFRQAFEILCQREGYQLYVPSAKYCNDNGVMIAWNGVERFQERIGIYGYDQLDLVDVEPKCPLGENYSDRVLEARITCDWLQLNELRTNTSKMLPTLVIDDTEQDNRSDENKITQAIKQ